MRRSIYFNYAGVASLPFHLFWELAKYLCSFYFTGPRPTLLRYERYMPLLNQEIATLLGCSPSEITYTKNTTEGIIIAAESLPLKPGDELLVLECEYPANLIPWLKKREDGIQVQVIPGANSAASFENLIQAISPRTRAISLSWVQFQDGYMSNIRRLSEICQAKGIFLVVDAVQIVGTRAIDLKKYKIDFLVCGGHKHLMSTMGSGFIYIRQETLPALKPFKLGIRSVDSFSSEGYQLKSSASRFEDGTANLLGIVALYYRVRSINQMKIQDIERKCIELLNHYKDRLKENQIEFIDYPEQGNILSIPVQDPAAVMGHLEKHGIFVKAINRQYIRVAFSYRNGKQEIEKFIRVFKRYLEASECRSLGSVVNRVPERS